MGKMECVLVDNKGLVENPKKYINKRVRIRGAILEDSVAPYINNKDGTSGFGGLLDLRLNRVGSNLVYFKREVAGPSDKLNAEFGIFKHLEDSEVILEGKLSRGSGLNYLLKVEKWETTAGPDYEII